MLQRWICWIGCLVFISVGSLRGEEPRLCETLLPDTTQGFVAISNVDRLNEHWTKTQLGQMMADPAMEPFAKDIHRQFEERWSSIHERLGLTLDDMKGVPGGDVGIAMIAPGPGQAALAIVVDVTGKLPEANELLKKATAAQLARGAKRSEVKVPGSSDAIIQFDLPEPSETQEAARSELKGSEKSEATKATAKDTDKDKAEQAPGKPTRQAFYCLTGTLLVVTDHLEVMQGILARALGKAKGSLNDHKPFQVVRDRCRADAPKELPQIRWFIHPLGYAEVARIATPPENRRKGKTILEVMRNQGVGGVQGAGGFVDFSSEGYELIHRTAVYAPEPREKAMKMLVLPNEKFFTPQPWVPRNIANYITLNVDVLNAFDNFDSLFDELVGEGEKGVWKDTLVGLSENPDGPQLNLREEIFKHFSRRVSIMSDYQLPITPTSERLLIAVETTDPKAVAKGIEKWMANDPTAKRHEVDGQVIWEMVEEEAAEVDAPQISFADVPAVGPQPPKKKTQQEVEEKASPLMPHMSVTVWQGHLIIASHMDFLTKVIHPAEQLEPLSSDPDVVRVNDEIKKLKPDDRCVQAFTRTDEAYRPTYELIRQNKMPESESLFGRLLNAMFGEGKKGVARHQKIDGSQMPEYQTIRRYLGPAGFQTTTEKDGWFIKGFTLTKHE